MLFQKTSADINVKTENKVQSKLSFFLSAKSTNSKKFISSNLAGKANTSYPSNNTANQQSNVLAVTSCSLPSTKTKLDPDQLDLCLKSLAETQTIHDFDICTYHKRVKGCSNQEKLILINNVFVPDTEFVFPKTKGRSFRLEWFKQFSWLRYSLNSKSRLKGLLKQFDKDRKLLTEYNNVFIEQEKLKIIESAPETVNFGKNHYLPHRP